MSLPTQKQYDELYAGYATLMLSLQDVEAELTALRSASLTLAAEMQDETCAWGNNQCCEQIERWARHLTQLSIKS